MHCDLETMGAPATFLGASSRNRLLFLAKAGWLSVMVLSGQENAAVSCDLRRVRGARCATKSRREHNNEVLRS